MRSAAVAASDSASYCASPACSTTYTTSAPTSASRCACAAIPGAPARSACTSPPPVWSAICRAAVTASSPALRISPPRDSANANTFAIVLFPSRGSEDLRFGLEQAHQLRHGTRALADDAARRALGRQLHLLHGHARASELGRTRVQGLLLRRHDALERR